MVIYARCENCKEILEVSPNTLLHRVRHKFRAEHAKHRCKNGEIGIIKMTIEEM